MISIGNTGGEKYPNLFFFTQKNKSGGNDIFLAKTQGDNLHSLPKVDNDPKEFAYKLKNAESQFKLAQTSKDILPFMNVQWNVPIENVDPNKKPDKPT